MAKDPMKVLNKSWF